MTVDLTGIAVSVIAGIFGVVGPLFLWWLQQHIKNETAKATFSNALTNGLGMIQQAAEGTVRALHPKIDLPGVPEALKPGVQYVLTHAGDEAARLGNTPLEIAEKLIAREGTASIASNIAAAGAAGPTPKPLDPVPDAALAPSVIPMRGPLS